MHIHVSVSHPPAVEPDFHKRLHGPDQGIVNAWLAGLELRGGKEEKAAIRGELPLLPFKGGIDPPPPDKPIKKRKKTGSYWYLSMWQGLRSQDLDIDTGATHRLTCALTGVEVTFTLDTEKPLKQT